MTLRTLTTTLLLATLVLGGMTACQSKSSEMSSSTASPTAETPQAETSPTSGTPAPDRAQRREAMRKQIEAVLTADQQKQLQTKLQQGEKMRQALSELNLTDDQKTKIQEIFKSNRRHSDPTPATPAPGTSPS